MLRDLRALTPGLFAVFGIGFCFQDGLLAQSRIIPLRTDYWNDEAFIKSFTYTYPVKTTVEPTINSEEKEIFDLLRPQIQTNINTAITTLQANIVPESNAALNFILGNLYFEAGHFDQAIPQYEVAIRKFPNFMRAYNLLGMVHVRIDKLAKAIPYLIKTIQLGGADGDIFGLLGYCYLNEEKFDSALSAFQQALLFAPDSLDWKVNKAQCLLLSERWAESAALFEEILKEKPDKPEFWLSQANAFLGMERTEESAANYEILRRLKKATPDSLFQLGDIYMNENLPNLAFEVYQQALGAGGKQDPGRAIRVARILVERAAWPDAGEYIFAIRETCGDQLTEEDHLRLVTLESQIASATGDIERAASLLKEIVAKDPMNGQALLLLARLQADEGEIEEAIFNFEAAQKLREFKVRALLAQAQMHVRLTQYGLAVPLLGDAYRLDPQHRIQKYLDAVEQADFSSRLQ